MPTRDSKTARRQSAVATGRTQAEACGYSRGERGEQRGTHPCPSEEGTTDGGQAEFCRWHLACAQRRLHAGGHSKPTERIKL